jgi:sulfate permease, SulP family
VSSSPFSSSLLARSARIDWFASPKADILAGVVVALALIPEAISFSIIAGVDPKVGLYASFSIAIIIAFAGGRRAMISAATGAMALVMVPLVRDHGVQYLFAATILAGVIQVAFGVLGVAKLMRFVPRSVMTGFVNALAILIFTAQLDHFIGGGLVVYAMVAAGIAIIYLLPRLTTAVPSPLVAIVVVGGAAAVFKLVVPTVGDMGDLPSALPSLALPNVPFALETLTIIGPVALTLAIIGLLESLMTAQLMDDITDENSDGDRESRGQGIANIATGFLGGMAGCAMIGQSMINLRSGGRTRLSTLTAGVSLLILILVAGSVVKAIPMAALVAVMIVVAISTFQWNSITPSALKRSPRSETAVMVVTVAVVVITHNLALGVLAGVILSAIFFARRVAHVVEVSDVVDTDLLAGSEAGTRVYRITGELFFASTNELIHAFDYHEETPHVIIDLTEAHIWDSSAVAVLDTVVAKFARHGTHAEIIGLNVASTELHDRLSGHMGSGH